MTLQLSGEKRALAFFTSIVETAKDAKVRDMAAGVAEEQAEHVNIAHRLPRKYPKPADWSQDGDPALAPD